MSANRIECDAHRQVFGAVVLRLSLPFDRGVRIVAPPTTSRAMSGHIPSTLECQGLYQKLLRIDWVRRHNVCRMIKDMDPLLYLRLLTMFDTTQHYSGIHSGRPPRELPDVMVATLGRGWRQLTLEESFELSWRNRR